MTKRSKKILAALLVAALAGAAYYFAAIYGRQAGPGAVRTTGVVEAVEINVSPKIAGKLDFVGFREGDHVKAGDLVASLEDDDLLAACAQARSALAAAGANLENGHDAVGKASADVAVADAAAVGAKAAVARAEAQIAQADKDLRRAGALFEKGVVARADLDRAETAVDTRKAELDGAMADLALAVSRTDAARAALRQAEGALAALKAGVSEAKDHVAYRDAQLSYAKTYAPVDSVVEYRSLEPGEVVAPGQSILTLVDLSTIWVRVDLQQRHMDGVRVGSRAWITVDGVPDRVFEGEVFDVGREGGFATERDVTRGQQDIKAFRTRIRVKDPDGALWPGMTVSVEMRAG